VESRRISSRISLYYSRDEKETANTIEKTCIHSSSLIREIWNLEEPKEYRVYVMTSWLHFVFHSAPWYGCIFYGLLLPFWAFRARKMWKFSGGWTLQYSKRPVFGVKPPRLLEKVDRSIGDNLS